MNDGAGTKTLAETQTAGDGDLSGGWGSTIHWSGAAEQGGGRG